MISQILEFKLKNLNALNLKFLSQRRYLKVQNELLWTKIGTQQLTKLKS